MLFSRLKRKKQTDMALDIGMVEGFYASYAGKVGEARALLGRPMTYTEKILYAHTYGKVEKPLGRGCDYAELRPDRVAMQDATAQMALLQFMTAGKERVAVPATVHCDHLIRADRGAGEDISTANAENSEVYGFLKSVSRKYHIGFWGPGAGIIHQVVLENYAFPGGLMIGTDSHTPNAGGLGMAAVGVGGADAVDVLTAQPWELRMPLVTGVRLTGRLSGWASPKDVILQLLGMLSVKGGTNHVIEYFGPGVESISATGRATICNMGAELGATCSLFPFDEATAEYLEKTGRADVAALARANAGDLRADAEAVADPEAHYDRFIEIDLGAIEPKLNGPFTPDAATPLSAMKEKAAAEGWPLDMEVALVGSCTNSSYEDLARVASVAAQAMAKGIRPKAKLIVNPGSEQIRRTAERDGIMDTLRAFGAVVMANACGPCIGQWKRHTDDNTRRNSIVTSFNRNFRSRADGNPNTFAFIGSPETATALAIAGRIDFDPARDTVENAQGEPVMLDEPSGDTFPPGGFATGDNGFTPPTDGGAGVMVEIAPESDRLQRLEPFPKPSTSDFENMALLIKTRGKCTTDHISMAGAWLKYRGHLQNISANLLMGATNAFNGQVNSVLCQVCGSHVAVSEAAKAYKEKGIGQVIAAEENYGEGSSREHAAMEPRFLGVKAVIAKSFARIHETNLKKQGILALTFADKDDYGKVRQDDRISIPGALQIKPGEPLAVTLAHSDSTVETIAANHTYNQAQVGWFVAGSALNALMDKK